VPPVVTVDERRRTLAVVDPTLTVLVTVDIIWADVYNEVDAPSSENGDNREV